MNLNERFHEFSTGVSRIVGSPYFFVLVTIAVVVWAITGPILGFSDTWQLIINTATNIFALLVVILIQNTQNRDAKAIHIKLDELLKAAKGARTSLVDLEDVPDEELERLHEEFRKLHEHYAKELARRRAKK